VKALAWILTAAAVLIGADVFVMSAVTSTAPEATISEEATDGYHTMEGGNGFPPARN
jgi:hypothetical protein